MVRLNGQERTALSQTIRELANFVAAGLVLGQIIAERPRWWLLGAGSAPWAAFVMLALLLLEGVQEWKARS
jgi:hypothetical protein